ncbi:hypothetical protein NMY22_g1512 [Coprinellus aureogranulatus]|nr:hypothetical protein NMY22_g1512 [Coprinellus aureogranulatus]
MESPFQAHLDTNYVPSDSERVHIEEFLQGPLEELRDIEAELKDVEVELEAVRLRFQALNEKKEECERFIARHSALFNPIRILPDEILHAIFDRCTPDRQSFPARAATDHMSAGESPLLLTYVCQRWREIALDYRALWVKPYISTPPFQGDKARWNKRASKAAQLAGLWLSRTAGAPLDLTIISLDPDVTRWGLNTIWEAISPSSMQWQVLQLGIANPLLHFILSLPSDSVPRLEHLRILASEINTTGMNDLYASKNIIGGPSIHEISFHGGAVSLGGVHSVMRIPFPWHRLTNLTTSPFPLSRVEVLSICTRAPNLQRLFVRINTRLSDVPVSQNPGNDICLPKLTLLAIITNGEITNLLSRLRLPNLKVATLDTPEAGTDSLIAMIQLSQGNLRHLTVHSKAITSAEMTRCLALTPQLKCLWLFSRHSATGGTSPRLAMDEVLASLTPSQRQGSTPLPPPESREREVEASLPEEPVPCLCPNLKGIKLDTDEGPRITGQVIFEFIKGRRELRPQKLRTVTMIDRNRYSEMDVVEELKKEGVDTCGMSIDLQYRRP